MNSKSKLEVKELLEEAAECLFTNQPDIYNFLDTSRITEWNVCHHYANEVSKHLPGYDCDVEIKKTPYGGGERPDIIVHKRGTHNDNFLVIEVKLKMENESVEALDKCDKQKIEKHWFKGDLLYRFGALVNFKRGSMSSRKIWVLKNSQGR